MVNFSNLKGVVVWKIKELDESNNCRFSLQKSVKFSKEAINSDDFINCLSLPLSSAEFLSFFYYLVPNMSVQFNHGDLSVVFQGSHSAKAVEKSVGKLSSGQKNLKSMDDPGAFQQVIKFKNDQKRTELTLANLQNLVSYTQAQDKVLAQADDVVQKLNHLSALALDVTKNDQDRSTYNHEFEELVGQLGQLKQSTFNGLNLFMNAPFSAEKKEFIQILQSQWLSGAEQTVLDRLGLQGTGQNILKIEVPEDDVFPTIWTYMTNVGSLPDGTTVAETTVQFHLDTYKKASFPIATPSDWAERYNVTLMSKLIMADNLFYNELANGTAEKGGSSNGGASWFKEGVSQFTHGGDYLLEYLDNSGVFIDQNFVDSIGDGDTTDGSIMQNGSSYYAVRYLHDLLTDAEHGGGIKDMLVWMSAQVSAGKTPQESSIGAALKNFLPGTFTDSTTANDDFISDYKANVLTYPGLSVSLFNPDTGAIGGADSDGGSVIDEAGAVPDYPASDPTTDPLVGFLESWEEEGTALYSYSAGGENLVFETVTMPTVENTATYNLKTLDSAKSTLGFVETLIESLADQRARVGSNLQRLFYETERQEKNSMNRESVLGRINGLDLAMESAKLAKNQLMLQANQSILKGSQADDVYVGDLLSGVKAASNKI